MRMDEVEQIEKRVTILEADTKIKVEKLTAIELLLKKIEICLIGGVGEEQIGLVSQVREDRKTLEDLKTKVALISESHTDLLEERKRVKWVLRSIWAVFSVIIGYWLKFGK